MTASLSVDMLTTSTGPSRLTAATISSLHNTTNAWSSALGVVEPLRLVRQHLLISKRALYIPSFFSLKTYTAAQTAFKDASAKLAGDGVPLCCAGLVDLGKMIGSNFPNTSSHDAHLCFYDLVRSVSHDMYGPCSSLIISLPFMSAGLISPSRSYHP